MNREEAIRKVENCLASYFPMEDYGEVEEIIKALKQESCEDAISRKAMLDYQQYLYGRMSNEENHKLWEFIKDLPSVTPVQKAGQWIFVDDAHEHARCSECGYGNVDLFNGRPHNYCPNCGTKMGEDALTTMMSISEYKLIAKEGYNNGYYWDTRYCFELNGTRYILTDIGSCSGYIPTRGEIMEVENDENLDMLLKDWTISNIYVPDDLAKEDAIQYVKQLKDSGTAKGEAFELWNHDWTTEYKE